MIRNNKKLIILLFSPPAPLLSSSCELPSAEQDPPINVKYCFENINEYV